MDLSRPAYLQGVFEFTGSGYSSPTAIEGASYTIPYDKRGQLIYFRAGNSTDNLINVALYANGKPVRYFPVGASNSVHVPLAVVEDLAPETLVEIYVAAPESISGTLILDVGFVEI